MTNSVLPPLFLTGDFLRTKNPDKNRCPLSELSISASCFRNDEDTSKLINHPALEALLQLWKTMEKAGISDDSDIAPDSLEDEEGYKFFSFLYFSGSVLNYSHIKR